MTDQAFKSFFGEQTERWAGFKQTDPAYHAGIESFITAIAAYGITSSRPAIDESRVYSHAGIRRLIEDFIRQHPDRPLPLEQFTFVRLIHAESCQADLDALLSDLAGARHHLIRFSKSYNISTELNLHVAGFDAERVARLCGFREDSSLETITVVFGFPPLTPDQAGFWRDELATFLEDPRAHAPGVLLAGFPLCFAPPSQFKALLRYSVHNLRGLIGSQRKSIQSVLGAARKSLPRCTTCRNHAACHAFTAILGNPDYDAVVIPQTGDSVAFIGGSIPKMERPADERLVITTPAEQGDLLMAILAGFRNILIIDGYFYSKFPCTTFEVMLALEQGLNVFGAASIGALRAVELDHYGMTGMGYVYDTLKRKPVKPYHIVAQTYTEEDAALTPPLADIIYFLNSAVAAGVLAEADSKKHLAVATEIPFPLLSFPYFLEQAGGSPELRKFLKQQGGPTVFNIKKQDALKLLSSYRGILAGREPGYVRDTFLNAAETYLGRLHRKYKEGHDLCLMAEWQSQIATPPSPGSPASGRRARSARETCRLAEAFFRDLDVTVADTTGYDPPSGSYILNVFFPPFYFLNYPLSSSTGNGDIYDEALASAYMELVERIPTHNFKINALKYGDLDQDPLPAEQIPQYYNFAASPLIKDQVVADHGYVNASDVLSGKSFFIPRFAVMSMFTGTDGNAAGNTLAEAILYGLYELVERDTNQLYVIDPVCRDALPKLRLNPAALENARIQALLQRLGDKGYKIALYYLPNSFGIPCLRCRVFDQNRGIECHGGSAARLDFESAVLSTLHEAYMQHISYFTGMRDDYRSMQSHKEAYITYQNALASLFRKDPQWISPVRHESSQPTTTIPEELRAVMTRLKEGGIQRIIVADTSPAPEFGLKSVKVIVPGLELWFVPEYKPSGFVAARIKTTRSIMEKTIWESK